MQQQKEQGDGFSRYRRRCLLVSSAGVLMVPLVVAMAWGLMPSAYAIDNGNVDGANGVLHVRGALTESACRLEMASARQDVDLGDTGTARLQQPGDRGKPTAVRLQLRDCLRSPANTADPRSGNLLWSTAQPAVSVSFIAPADADSPQLVKVNGVSGLALRLTDALGRDVRLGSRGAPLLLTPGQDALVYSVAPERTRAPLLAGAYSAQVDFRLSYD
jgi:type 1 fimbria pilin